MATLIPEQIDALSHEMRVCAALAGELATTAARAFGRLQGLLEAAVEGPFKTPFETPLHLSGLAAWRAAHRVGTPSKIATDPELRAFVEARIGNLTFKDLAAEIADAFPPDRRVALSSLHRWWHRNRHGMAPAKGPGKSPRPKPPARVRHGSGMTGGLPALRYPPPPAQIAPYVTALGPELAVTFLLTFGGAELYFAKDPKGSSQVEALLGPDLTRTLQAALGTYPRRIPLGKKWIAHYMSTRGDSLATIARTLRTTDVSVRRWLK